MSLQRWKCVIEYDGTAYHGFQLQTDGCVTVQERIEQALHAFCQQDIRIHVAGRTDSGVHALGQVIHFDLDYGERPLTGFDLAKALNAHLRDERIACLTADAVDADFHARFHATNKLYRYRILNRPAPPTLTHGHVWHRKYPLDMEAMNKGAEYFLGHHDFSSFRASECQSKTVEKTIDRAIWTREGEELIFEVEGRSFLHHQVRNMVGTLTLVGEGKWAPEQIKHALLAKKREAAGPTAPAEGLTLVRIDYDDG